MVFSLPVAGHFPPTASPGSRCVPPGGPSSTLNRPRRRDKGLVPAAGESGHGVVLPVRPPFLMELTVLLASRVTPRTRSTGARILASQLSAVMSLSACT